MTAFRPPACIETDELILRPFMLADADQIYYAFCSDPRVTEWLPMPTHRSVEQTRAYIGWCVLGWERGVTFTWGLFGKTDGRLCALIELNVLLPRVELGVVTSSRPGHVRRKAGLSVLKKLTEWLIGQPQIHRLYACCAPEGKAAATMERLGFKFEGRLPNWEPRPNRNLSAGDVLMFAKTKPPSIRPL